MIYPDIQEQMIFLISHGAAIGFAASTFLVLAAKFLVEGIVTFGKIISQR